MVGQILDPSKELQDDHRQARDGLLDLLKACRERDLRKAREIVAFIDAVAGPPACSTTWPPAMGWSS